MKIHGLARVKNEGDVIEEFVRYNLQHLDALTVIDNASFDGTLTILESLREEGLPLTILHDPALPKRQAEIMTRLARRSARESDWDFLFLLDADEFLRVPDRRRLEESLSALPHHTNGLVPWLTYVPTANDPISGPSVLARIPHRLAAEAEPAQYKCVISRSFVNEGEFTMSQGNHVASHMNGESPIANLADVALAHFPVRSIGQIQGKVLLGWGAYLAMNYDAAGLGWHQRRLFERLESTPAWTAGDMYEIALRYGEQVVLSDAPAVTYDRLEPVLNLRYGDVALRSPMQVAAGYVRQLAGALGRCEQAAADQRVSAKAPSDRELDAARAEGVRA